MLLKRIMFVLVLLVSLVAAQAASSLEEEFNAFSSEQMEVLQHAYDVGKPFNLGYTMAAIAWQESRCGKYVLNLQDPSAGVFQNNIKSVMARHMQKDPSLKDTDFQRNLMAQKLFNSFELSAAEALAELEFWITVRGTGNWFKIWQSYNGGYWADKPDTKGYRQSYQYATEINAKVNYLIFRYVLEKTKLETEGL